MRKVFVMFMLAMVALSAAGLSGCVGTIYGSAVDERSVGQQSYDRQLRTSIEAKYAQDSEVSYWGTSVYVFMADVYLVGEYTSEATRDKAIQIARQTEGVRNVYTYFQPEKATTCGFTDRTEMRAEINYELYGTSGVTAPNVEFVIVQCDVVLLGILSSQAEIDKTIGIVKGVKGVQNVKSFLRLMRKAPPAGAKPAK